MPRKFFGTDGIRGLTNKAPMTADIALKVGQAAGAHFGQQTIDPEGHGVAQRYQQHQHAGRPARHASSFPLGRTTMPLSVSSTMKPAASSSPRSASA